ncbi:MAG: putative Ig domain-containing protein [Myxococcota bacterium]
MFPVSVRSILLVCIALMMGACGSAINGSSELGTVGGETAAVPQDVETGESAAESDTSERDAEGPESDAFAEDVGPQQSQVCPPGLSGCVEGNLLTCNEDGTAFELIKCDSWLVCWEGACITCVESSDCTDGAICEEGECVFLDLAFKTTELPTALQGLPYVFELEGEGGLPPYMWSIHQGELPEGYSLSGGGVLSGMTDDPGPSPLLIKLTDSNGDIVVEPLSLIVEEHGLYITTATQLPQVQGDDEVMFQFEAIGGEEPYFWGLAEGEMPPGLALSSDGLMTGTPEAAGTFEFTLKAFDNGAPPLVDTKDFMMAVTIPPLEVVGSPELDLFVTKVIVLPLIFIIPSFPVPYDVQLQAVGGSKPLSWSEDPLPSVVSSFIPNGGIPEGLTLSEDGRLSGSVTDPGLAVTVTVPVLNFDLYGFFFGARVDDAQLIPYSDSALFLIPTLPVDF